MVLKRAHGVEDSDKASQVSATHLSNESAPLGCGPGILGTPCLEKLNNAKCLLVCLSLSSFAQGLVVNGLVNIVITTIERRYNLSSSQTGLIASSYDIASLICLLPVSYFGGAGHRNRWLSTGMLILGAGSILFSIPHFAAGVYEPTSTSTSVCQQMPNADGTTPHTSPACASPLSRFRYFFIFAQLLHGAGSSPLYTLGISYLDDSVKPKLSSIYVGIFYVFSMLGPAVGFLVGGQLLRIYIDFEKVDVWPVVESGPAFLGAWWIGFLVVIALIAVPLAMFPADMPHSEEFKAQRIVETQENIIATDATRPGFGGNIRDLPKAIKCLLMNVTFVLLSLSVAADAFVVTGLTAYGPKLLQSQFGYSASNAALVMGAATIPMGCGGTLLGSYLVKRFQLSCSGVIKLCLGSAFLAFCCIFNFLIKCPDTRVAGVNVPYNLSLSSSFPDSQFCNAPCNCSPNEYDPVCATATQTVFLSPCLAGCIGNGSGVERDFFSCSCIGESLNRSLPVATRDSCAVDCGGNNYAFIVAFAFGILFTFLYSIPVISATLRCVTDSQRPLALGVQWVIIRLLGSIPGPLSYGAAIDTVCTYWQPEPCGVDGRGRCLVYSNVGLSNAMFAIAAVGKGLTLLFFALAWWFYKPAAEKPVDREPSDNQGRGAT